MSLLAVERVCAAHIRQKAFFRHIQERNAAGTGSRTGDRMQGDRKIPNHVAIILDGNGRWAKSKGMPRNYGHVQGAKAVEIICEEAYRMGIQYLTVYAFSTENWNRPQDEVDALMKLLRNYLKTCLKTAEKNRMCVRIL